MKNWLKISCLLLALAVVLGAFGAHGLKDLLNDYSRAVYEKAVFYHFTHALGMFCICLLPAAKMLPERDASRVLLLMSSGILIFSGSLYLLAITGMKWLGAITPLGGTAFIVSWLSLAWRIQKVPDCRHSNS